MDDPESVALIEEAKRVDLFCTDCHTYLDEFEGFSPMVDGHVFAQVERSLDLARKHLPEEAMQYFGAVTTIHFVRKINDRYRAYILALSKLKLFQTQRSRELNVKLYGKPFTDQLISGEPTFFPYESTLETLRNINDQLDEAEERLNVRSLIRGGKISQFVGRADVRQLIAKLEVNGLDLRRLAESWGLIRTMVKMMQGDLDSLRTRITRLEEKLHTKETLNISRDSLDVAKRNAKITTSNNYWVRSLAIASIIVTIALAIYAKYKESVTIKDSSNMPASSSTQSAR